MGGSSLFKVFTGKIFHAVLSPLYRYEKPPYIRGDTGGGRGIPYLPLPLATFSTHSPFNTFGGSQFSPTFTAPTLVPYFSPAIYYPIKQSAINKAKSQSRCKTFVVALGSLEKTSLVVYATYIKIVALVVSTYQ